MFAFAIALFLLIAGLTAPGAEALSPQRRAAQSSFCATLKDVVSEVSPNCTLAACDLNAPQGVLIKCNPEVMDQKLILVAGINVCGDPPSANITVGDASFGIFKSLNIQGQGKWDVPGLSFEIPHLASAGVTATYDISTMSDTFSFTLGLQLCGSVVIETICFPLTPVSVIDISESITGLCDG